MSKATFLLSIALLPAAAGFCQSKPPAKEKPPTQKEAQDMMKEAQKMMEEAMKEMSPEDKKMMDSMGIKMPDMKKAAKNISGVTDQQWKEGFEKENRIVPPKNSAKIAAIPGAVSKAGMGTYITSVQSKTAPLIKPAAKTLAAKLYAKMAGQSPGQMGNAAAALWMMGKTQVAVVLMGKACAASPGHTDNLGNYASMLSMLGAQHLALPILNNLNTRFPKNSTILNNIAQAWFGLGDLPKAEKYIDSTVRIFGAHTQANYTKALIEESKGNQAGAIAAMKKSMQQAYSSDKEAKLRQLGYTPTANDFKIPGNKKPDPLNLGGFQPPPYPTSVMECVTIGAQWKEYRGEIAQAFADLKQKKEQQDIIAQKASQQRVSADINLVKAAMVNPGVTGPLSTSLLFATRAGKKLAPASETWSRKVEQFGKKLAAFTQGEAQQLKKAYEAKMDKLREEDAEQTGEGKPNRDYCPMYRDASDQYLKVINPKLESFFKEFLEIEKVYISEAAHWEMYMTYPEHYESMKTAFKMQWLNDLADKKLFSFISITEFVCKAPLQTKGNGKLQKFDDVNCQYHSSFWTPAGSMEMNCSQWTTKLGVGFFSAELKQNMDEQTFGDQFQSCTIELGPKMGKEVEIGPLTVGAEAGVGAGVEIDRSGVKDVFVTAGVEAGASIGDPISQSAGMEGRISIVSGTGSINGTGAFEGLR